MAKQKAIHTYIREILAFDIVDFDHIKIQNTIPFSWVTTARLKSAAEESIKGYGETIEEAVKDLHEKVLQRNSTFVWWKGQVLITYGEIGDALGNISTRKEAKAFLNLYQEAIGANAIHNIAYLLMRSFSKERAADIKVLFNLKEPK